MKLKLALIMCMLIAACLSEPVKRLKKEETVLQGIIRDAGCFSCRTIIGTLSFLIINKYGIKFFELGTIGVCTVFLFNFEQCKAISKAYVSMIMTNLKVKTFEPNYFCEIFLGVCKPKHYKFLDPKDDAKRILADKPDFIKDNNYINKLYAEIAKDKREGKKRETMLMYHISDLHFNLEYLPGSSNVCNTLVCCNAKAGKPKKKEDAAGKWGDYNCDSNPMTLNQLRHTINMTGEPDLVVWTGDNVDHGVWLDPSVSTNATVEITQLLSKHAPNAVIFPIHGNHEFDPMNTQDFKLPYNPVIDIVGDTWSHWLTPEVKSEYLENTYFSYNSTTHPKTTDNFKRKMRDTRIIALNTQNCYFFNFYLIGEFNDPGQEFEWLENLLRQMEKDGEVGIIIGHVPPGDPDCLHAVSSRLRILYDRYQHIIRLNLFGHIHYEEFEVIRGIEDNKPIGSIHITSSFTPHTDQNPSIRAITLDVATKLPVKIETYTMDLVKANQDDEYAKFFLNHEFAQEYNLPDLSPNSLLYLSMTIKVNEEIAKKYRINMLAGGRGSDDIRKNGCDEKCRRMASCMTAYSDYRDSRK